MPEHVFRYPKEYSKNNPIQYNFALQMLSNASLTDASRILDIGCGDGVFV